jgi:hypothetical protein
MAGKTLSYFNLTGGLNTVQTMATINSTPNRTESPDMVNIEYFKLSGIRTMNGNVGLNKVEGETSPLNSIPDFRRINFGYEYIQGNYRYMIVADKNTLYEYNPLTDTFTDLISFDTSGDGITICGYANGIVAASPVNNYLIYYRKDREAQVGTVSTASPITKTLTYTGTQLASLGSGDIVTINNTEYNIDSVDVANSTITLVETPSTTYTNKPIILSNFTKIPCVYTSVVQNGNSTTTTTTRFIPKVIQSHQGRLWVGATLENETVAAYVIYSDLGNIHNMFEGGDASFYDAGYFEEFWEDTSDITAIGTWDKYVVVHKREHTYLINTSNSDANSWNVESYSDYTCDNQLGFVKANNGYYTYCSSAGGIYPMIQRTIYSAISQGADASTKIRDTFLNLNIYKLDEIYAVYHPYKKYIMFYMPIIGEEGSKNCYILDLQTRSWLHRRIPQNVTCAFEFDNKVYVGTEDGKIYEEFRGTDFDGQPINFSWKSPWFIWSGGTNWTTTREIRVKMSQEGTNNFYVRNRRDGAEDYKQRTITNTSNQVHSLMWDAGILTNDIDENYQNQLKVYSYDGADGNTYYALESPLRPLTPMYSSQPTNYTEASLVNVIKYGGFAQALSYEQLSTSSDYDTAEWGQGTIYCYTNTTYQPTYVCYQSSKDANIKAWVKRTGNHTTATVNVKDKVKTTKYLAFRYYNYSNDLITTPTYITESDYKNYWNTKNKYIKAYGYKNGSMVHTATQGSVTGTSWIWTSSEPNGTAWKDNRGRACVINTAQTGYFMFGGNPFRYSADDKTIKSSTTTEVWNGKTTRSGKTKTVSYYSSSYITIDGVRYNRYTAGDEGQDATGTTNVYSRKSRLAVGDTVYTTSELSTVYGTVSNVSGTDYTISGKIFVPNSSGNFPSDDTKYYKTYPVFPTFNISGTEVGSINAKYQIPDDTLDDDSKMLTDSKWDGNEEFEVGEKTYEASYSRNAQGVIINDPPDSTPPDTQSTWVNTGQVTKRFPIDRQYFQTLQLEFCGETSEQGIELYGFEVDGIQLTEVPW